MPKTRVNRQNNSSPDTIRDMNSEINARLQKIDERQRNDHDTLIKLESKTDQILSNTNEMKDGMNKRLTDLETKMQHFEELEIAIDPKKVKLAVDELVSWKDKFGFTWKLVATTSSIIAAVVGFILGTLSQLLNFFEKH